MDEHTTDPSVGPPVAGRSTGWLADAGRWEHDTLRRATEHRVRSYNAGHYAAHDRSESVWPGVNELYRQGSRYERPTTSR